MSRKHPIIAVTGASGAGTTAVKKAFIDIFRRNGINAALVDGDGFRRYDRGQMRAKLEEAEAAGRVMSPYSPDVNRFDLLESLFEGYGAIGGGRFRHYISREFAASMDLEEGTFSDWQDLPADSDLLFYEGLHGGVVADRWTRRQMSPSHNPRVIKERRDAQKNSGIDVARHVDLLLGVVPVVNLEWIQKISRDTRERGYSAKDTTRRIIERMRDYIHFVVPQFSVTDINFQRVPVIDTSNPFVTTRIPKASECIVVIRFRDPARYDFSDILKRIDGARMSRPNTMVISGSQMQQALDVVCTPLIHELLTVRNGE
jgi:phosphoribulokinase